MPVSFDTPPVAARPSPASTVVLALVWLGLALLLCASSPVRAAETDRQLLSGSVDSRADLWEARQRVPLPGVIVSSETYMAVRDVPDQTEPGGFRRILAFFNIHRAEPVGDLAPRRQQAMARIALDGVIRSYDAGAVMAMSDAELARRFDLAGVISSDDRDIQPVAPGDARVEAAAAASLAEQAPTERGRFDRARVAAALLPAKVLHNLATPDLSTFVRHDSVDFDAGNATSTTSALVAARFDMALEQPRWQLNGIYNLEAAEYLDGALDGYINHTLSGDGLYRVSRRDSVHASAYTRHWNDRREQRAIEDFQATAAGSYENRSTGLQLGWQRGADRARWRHGVTASVDTVRVDFDGGPGYEQQARTMEADVIYRLRRRVSVLLDGQARQFDYSDQAADSWQARLRGGVEIDFSRRLSGRGVIGYARKMLDDADDSEDALVFDADLSWQLRRRTTLTLEAARAYVEVFERAAPGAVQDAYGLQHVARVGWQQDWTSRWSSRASMAFRDLEFRTLDRGSEDVQFMASGDYRLSPELTLSAQSAYTRSDDVIRGDYERWTFTLRLDLIRQ